MLLSSLAHVEPTALASLGALAGLAALGAFHGLNPAMGWLFAVALGLQQRSAWAITRALVFVTAGHAASLAVVACISVDHRGVHSTGLGQDFLGHGPVVVRRVQGLPLLPSSQVGRDAGHSPRPHPVVVPDGYFPRGGIDAGSDYFEPQ